MSETVFTLVVGAVFFLTMAGWFGGFCFQHIDIVNAKRIAVYGVNQCLVQNGTGVKLKS